MPPFGRLAALLVSAGSREAADSYAREVARAAPAAAKIHVLGPAEAPLAVIRGRHRYRLLVKAAREASRQMLEFYPGGLKHPAIQAVPLIDPADKKCILDAVAKGLDLGCILHHADAFHELSPTGPSAPSGPHAPMGPSGPSAEEGER